jgi:hypothetical protein
MLKIVSYSDILQENRRLLENVGTSKDHYTKFVLNIETDYLYLLVGYLEKFIYRKIEEEARLLGETWLV